MSEDTIKFPCVVNIKGFTEDQVINLTNAFVELGATDDENVDTNDHNIWKYYGVNFINKTVFWDDLSDYADNDEYEVTEYTYEEVMAFGNNTGEEVTVFTPSVSQPEPLNDWVEWKGGECPFVEGDVFDIKHKDGDIYEQIGIHNIHCNTWEADIGAGTIVAYRVRKAQVRDTSIPSSNNDTATLEPIEYEGIGSGETVSNQSVGASVAITANISFTVKIKGQEFTLDKDEIQELYIALCSAEGELQEWSLGQ